MSSGSTRYVGFYVYLDGILNLRFSKFSHFRHKTNVSHFAVSRKWPRFGTDVLVTLSMLPLSSKKKKKDARPSFRGRHVLTKARAFEPDQPSPVADKDDPTMHRRLRGGVEHRKKWIEGGYSSGNNDNDENNDDNDPAGGPLEEESCAKVSDRKKWLRDMAFRKNNNNNTTTTSRGGGGNNNNGNNTTNNSACSSANSSTRKKPAPSDCGATAATAALTASTFQKSDFGSTEHDFSSASSVCFLEEEEQSYSFQEGPSSSSYYHDMEGEDLEWTAERNNTSGITILLTCPQECRPPRPCCPPHEEMLPFRFRTGPDG